MSYRCPHCNEIIYSDWRQNRWRTNVWFLQWDQVESIDPEVLEDLKNKPKEIRTTPYYAYRNAGRVIERIIIATTQKLLAKPNSYITDLQIKLKDIIS